MSDKQPVDIVWATDELLEHWLDRLYALAEQGGVRFESVFDADGLLIEVSLVPAE